MTAPNSPSGAEPTDDELLALLHEKTPADLTENELQTLRARLESSPVIREALETEIALEGFLIAALAPSTLTAEQVIAAAQRSNPAAGNRSYAWVLLLLLPITLLMGVVLRQAFRTPKNDLAQNPPQEEKTAPEQTPPNPPAPPAAQPDSPEIPDQAVKPAPLSPQPAAGAPAAQKAPPAPPPTPWQAVVERAGEQPAWTTACFDEFDITKQLPRKDTLPLWFENAPGFGFRVSDVFERGQRLAALEGVARLKAPWLDDSSLRFWIENCNRAQLHIYHGDEGVTLVHHEDQWFKRWVAYVTRRKPGAVRPEMIALTSTDGQRARRTEIRFGGSYELAYADGELTLYRGDVPLVSAPLAGKPQEVYFDGRATFMGLALARTSGQRTRLRQSATTVDLERPADLQWTAVKPKLANPQTTPAGGIRLAGDNLAERAEIWAPLPQVDVQEVVLRVTGITPGAGVYIAHSNGKPHWLVRFQRNRRDGKTIAGIRGWDDEWQTDIPFMPEGAEPVVNDACWVSLLLGCGQLRWAISADGVHWGEVDVAQTDASPGQLLGVGLQVVAKAPRASITLERLQLRPLAAFSAIGPAGWQTTGFASGEHKLLADWHKEILAKKPAELDPAAWRRACALRTLAAGATRELGHALLEALLDDPAVKARPIAEQLAIVEEALLLTNDYRDQQSLRIGLPRRILDLGLHAMNETGAPPWSSVRASWFRGNWVTFNQSDASPEPLIRAEILQRIAQSDWPGLLDFCRTLRFMHLDEHAPLAGWAEAVALREAGLRREAAGESAVQRRPGWEPLLIESLSKEAYNFMSELQSLLDSEAWSEGGRMITTLDPAQSPGLAPYLRDKQLLASLPVVVRLTLRDNPQLRQALGEQFGPLARLRIGQAVAGADAAALELAAVQFEGSEEAADAHLWLGDRALARGWFDEAIEHYDRALRARPGSAGSIAPRRRLAAAMLGLDWGAPVTGAVSFGEFQLPAAEFEALVKEMRSRGSPAGALPRTALDESASPIPPPRLYTPIAKARFDGPAGDKPQEEVNGRTNSLFVPWPDRQMGLLAEPARLYVSNRFQVAAYETPSGKRLWQSQPPAGSQQRAQEWTNIPMRPLATDTRIIARQLFSRTPQLACWSKSDGKLQWSVDLGEREWIASDPVYLHGRLVVLSVNWRKEQQALVRWNVLDETTGEFQQQRDLFEVRSIWRARNACEVTAVGDSLYATLGGLAACIGAGGEVRWIRKAIATPPDEERRWILQTFDRPLVTSERLVVTQPGVRAVECLDPATGALHWRTVVPSLVGMVGRAGDLLVVRTEEGLLGLSLADGKRVWQTPLEQLQAGILCDGKQILCAARTWPEKEPNKKSFRLLWLDPSTGKVNASSPLAITHDDPRLGVLIPQGEKLWAFAGKGQHDPTRDLLELAPSGPPDEKPFSPAAQDRWPAP